MIAEIIAVGTELLMGQVLNTNGQYLARRLSEGRLTLHHQTTVGDNPQRLEEAVRQALSRADVVITTGGLGPTADDITKELCARALDLPMEPNAEAEAMVRGWFVKNGRPMTDNNLRQAVFPRGARILPNGYGTAPGCIAEKDGKAVINLPGPPRELIPMYEQSVAPYLAARSGAHLVSRYLRIFGMGESQVESLTGDLMRESVNPTLAPYCSTGEVQLRLTMRCRTPKEAAPHLDRLEAQVRQRLGDVIYAVTDRPDDSMERAAVEALRAAGKTVATAESCTGGLIASRLVNVPGASQVFLQGHVTYANRAKESVLGVRHETLAGFGAVSRETALEMAEGLFERSGADICLSVTGIAGPDGGTPDKPVGLVWLGLCTARGARAQALHLTGNRERIRTLAALHGLHWILRAARGQDI